MKKVIIIIVVLLINIVVTCALTFIVILRVHICTWSSISNQRQFWGLKEVVLQTQFICLCVIVWSKELLDSLRCTAKWGCEEPGEASTRPNQ